MRERTTFSLILVGLLWVVVAITNCLMIYGNTVGVLHLLTLTLSSLLAGLFFGQAIQKIRARRAEKKDAQS